MRSGSPRTTCGSKTERSRSPSDADELSRGLALIGRGEFFAAHEVLEDAWRASPAQERDFFQGLVHVAVAWYQAGRGRQIGCERQLAKAVRRLSPYAPSHRGVDVDCILKRLRQAVAVVESGSLDLPPPLGATPRPARTG